jgi:hypothetical protein
MNNLKIFCILLVLIFASQISNSQGIGYWFKAGSKPNEYEIGIRDEKYNDKPVRFIKSIQDTTGGFGTLMKYILPGDYTGKRVRLSGNIKTENVVSNAGMWMRVDSEEEGVMLGFDNMSDRPIKGTTDWTKYEIVLDVPKGTKGIGYGVLIHETGEAWFPDLTLEVVGNDVPTTNMMK